MNNLKIGELAKLTGVLTETIRFYEQEGVLMAAARSPGNYRLYGPEHVERLQFIRHCRTLDIAIDEIRDLLRLQDAPETDCGKIDEMLDKQITLVGQRIEHLVALQQKLESLRSMCDHERAIKDCRIMQNLNSCQARPIADGLDDALAAPAGVRICTRCA